MRGGQAEKVAGPCIVTISAGKFSLTDGGNDAEILACRLESGKEPAEIDLTEEGNKVPSIRGIYKVDGDTLTLCWQEGADRPKEFGSPAGTKIALLQFKRVKKKE